MSSSELPPCDLNGGVSPHEYEAEFGSLPHAPFDEPIDPYTPDGVCANFGVEVAESIGVF